MRLRRAWLALFALMVLFIAGCGSTHVVTSTVTRTVSTVPTAPHYPAKALAQRCPPGRSFMGCATPPSVIAPTHALAPPVGPKFPDVSVWQGAVNWPAVKGWQLAHGWKAAGIFKLGEYTLDSQAARNAALTRSLGFWRAGYWFVRNTGCSHEATLIVNDARAAALKVVVLDMEVPEAAGYAGCLTPPLRAAGFIVVIYSGPGTWPGGANDGLPLWVADYGFLPRCPLWTCSPVAWQYTDGHYFAPTFVPGVGFDDVSLDLGITKLGAAAPDPYAVLDRKVRHFGGITAREYNTVRAWDRVGCKNPVHRPTCRYSRQHLLLLDGRLRAVARRGGWHSNHRMARDRIMRARLNQH